MHPSLPYLLSSSDDMLIKLWDWEKGWICTQIFEGHSHYVMQASPSVSALLHFSSSSKAALIGRSMSRLAEAISRLDLPLKNPGLLPAFHSGPEHHCLSGAALDRHSSAFREA